MLCKARSKRTKEPCKRHAIVGGTVCPFHGGSAPQVREAARRRIAALVEPCLNRLPELIGSEDQRTALGAIKDVLDRAGLKTPEELKITQQDNRVDLSKLTDEELDAYERLQSKCVVRPDSGGEGEAGEAEDYEVLPE